MKFVIGIIIGIIALVLLGFTTMKNPDPPFAHQKPILLAVISSLDTLQLNTSECSSLLGVWARNEMTSDLGGVVFVYAEQTTQGPSQFLPQLAITDFTTSPDGGLEWRVVSDTTFIKIAGGAVPSELFIFCVR